MAAIAASISLLGKDKFDYDLPGILKHRVGTLTAGGARACREPRLIAELNRELDHTFPLRYFAHFFVRHRLPLRGPLARLFRDATRPATMA
jgi:hypothetical protein